METPAQKAALDKIKCPNCGALFPITETLHHQLAEQARDELKNEVVEQQKALAAREKTLKEREAGLLAAEGEIDQKVDEKLRLATAGIEKAALEKARAGLIVELEALKGEAAEKDKALKQAQEAEIQLRKERRELEEKTKALELEVNRRIDEEREKIRQEAAKTVLEEHRLKDAEKDKKLQDALKMNEELRLKLQQGSQQAQGEVLELELEEILANNFPADEIEPVPKGFKGADVLQHVNSSVGRRCGTIVWESKRTKNWSEGWLEKLRDDQRTAKADVAVLVTEVLPKDFGAFGLREGVWVTNTASLLGLATALRHTLIQVSTTKLAVAGKNEKIEVLFGYLTGPEFRQRVEAIIESFKAMKDDLEEEKRVSQKRWAKREKQIGRVIDNTAGMYGDLQGLIGTSMQSIPSLEAGDVEDLTHEKETE